MEMTIDNLEILAKGLDCMGDIEHAEDIIQAINIMYKYKKIVSICKRAIEDVNYEDYAAYYLDQIREVVNNGTEH